MLPSLCPVQGRACRGAERTAQALTSRRRSACAHATRSCSEITHGCADSLGPLRPGASSKRWRHGWLGRGSCRNAARPLCPNMFAAAPQGASHTRTHTHTRTRMCQRLKYGPLRCILAAPLSRGSIGAQTATGDLRSCATPLSPEGMTALATATPERRRCRLPRQLRREERSVPQVAARERRIFGRPPILAGSPQHPRAPPLLVPGASVERQARGAMAPSHRPGRPDSLRGARSGLAARAAPPSFCQLCSLGKSTAIGGAASRALLTLQDAVPRCRHARAYRAHRRSLHEGSRGPHVGHRCGLRDLLPRSRTR